MRALGKLLAELALRLAPVFLLRGGERRVSNIAILVANGFSILGVAFFGWNPILLMLVYWCESLAIGFFNVPKMILSGAIDAEGKFSPLGLAGGIFLGGFFSVHYGGFMAGHLIFLMLAGGVGGYFLPEIQDPLENIPWFWNTQWQALSGFFQDPLGFLTTPLFAAMIVFVSTGVQFWNDFVKPRAYVPLGADACMIEPYPRVFVMHLAILLGAIPLMLLKLPAGAMAVFVVLKVGAEVKAMNRAFEKRGAKAAALAAARAS